MPDSLDFAPAPPPGEPGAPVYVPAGPPPASKPRRNDSISWIAVLVVLVFWVLQSSFTTLIARVFKPHQTTRIAAGGSAADFPSEMATGLIAIEDQAKLSYLGYAGGAIPRPNEGKAGARLMSKPADAASSGSGPLEGSVNTLLRNSRQNALHEAERLLRRYPNQPVLAVRVILLRAEMGDPNPLALQELDPPPHAAPAKNTPKPLDPLAAFAPSKDEPTTLAASVATERQIFIDLYSSRQPISRAQEARINGQIESLSKVHWWGKIARHQAALRAGDALGVEATLIQIRREARTAIIGSSAFGALELAAMLVGVICLIVLFVRFSTRRQSAAYADTSVFAEQPPLIADDDRRLGAGDLGNLFCLYLALMTGLQFVLSSLPGDVLRHFLLRLPQEEQLTATIMLEFVFTAICGGLTFAAMFWLAKRRGADLSREIGLNLGGRSIGKTVAFGFLGWAVSLPILLAVSGAAETLFRGAPSPANPVIPLIMAAPAGVATLLIYILAAFVAPLFEETMFRGLFFNAARLRLGTTGAVLLTGAAFGLSHPVGIAEQVGLASLGAVFAWMAYTKKSLLPGMVAHFFQNTFVFGQMVFSLSFIGRPHLF